MAFFWKKATKEIANFVKTSFAPAGLAEIEPVGRTK